MFTRIIEGKLYHGWGNTSASRLLGRVKKDDAIIFIIIEEDDWRKDNSYMFRTIVSGIFCDVIQRNEFIIFEEVIFI